MICRRLFRITFVLILVQILGAEPPSIHDYVMDEWKLNSGFPSNSVTGIEQDQQGFMWFSTLDGLVRYDGKEFKKITFGAKNRPDLNQIISLYCDKKGIMWIGTAGGMRKYSAGVFQELGLNDPMNHCFVNIIKEDSFGNFWLGSWTKSLKYVERGNEVPCVFPHGVKPQTIRDIKEDKNGNIWISAFIDGLFYGKKGRFVRYDLKEIGEDYNVNTILFDRGNGMWVGTNHGLVRIINPFGKKDKKVIILDNRIGFPAKIVIRIFQDRENNIWLGTDKGIILVKKDDQGNFVFEKRKDSFLKVIFQDREDNIWFGSFVTGLKRLRYGNIRLLYEESNVPVFNNALYKEPDGTIWLGGMFGKIFTFQNGKFLLKYELKDKYKNNVMSIIRGNNEELWIGTELGGLFRLNTRTKNSVEFRGQNEQPLKTIRILHKDSKGRIWFGSDHNGVGIIKGDRIEYLDLGSSAEENFITSIYQDSKGDTWICTLGGLKKIIKGNPQGKKVVTYLKGKRTLSIIEDQKGKYFIGTNQQGLYILRNQKYHHLTVQDGLASDWVYQVLIDSNNNAWLSSPSGILKIESTSLEDFLINRVERVECRLFGEAEGLLSTICTASGKYSAITAEEGELWFSTRQGIGVVRPGEISINKFAPRPVIEKVYFNGSAVNVNVNLNSYEVEGIKNVRFQFTVPSFKAPENLKIFYMLEGWDKKWKTLDAFSERRVQYDDLPWGSYRFLLHAINGDGVKSDEPASFEFTLVPFFHETVLFKVLIFLSVIIFLVLTNYGVRRFFYLKKIKGKYKNSYLAPEKAEKVLEELRNQLEVKKIFEDEDLSLNSLSKKLGIAPRYLSQLINEQLKQNFWDLVNIRRIEEAKKLLTMPGNSETGILTIAFKVGFKTKEVFNRAFKKHTGMTPTQFRSRHIKYPGKLKAGSIRK